MTTDEFLRQRLFEPLGMDDTSYNIEAVKRDRKVPVHQQGENGELMVSEEQFPDTGVTVFGGTHGLFSTAEDYARFCQMMLQGGVYNGRQYLSPNTVALMTRNHVGNMYPSPGQGFGLGFGITTDLAASKSLGAEGQYYWSGAWRTYFFIDPSNELIGILLTQVQPYTGYYGDKMRQFIYQAITQ